MDGDAEAAEEFLVRKQEVDCEGRINLDLDRVFRGADKGLDAQILLDFLEEQLDLPAIFIDVDDIIGAQPEVIGQEFVAPASFWIPVSYSPQT